VNRRLRRLLRPLLPYLTPLAAIVARHTLRRGRTAVSVTLTGDGWTGRHVTRYGPQGEREYLCVGMVPWVRLEVWRDAPGGAAAASDVRVSASG
jgi:hypothetical protein